MTTFSIWNQRCVYRRARALLHFNSTIISLTTVRGPGHADYIIYFINIYIIYKPRSTYSSLVLHAKWTSAFSRSPAFHRFRTLISIGIFFSKILQSLHGPEGSAYRANPKGGDLHLPKSQIAWEKCRDQEIITTAEKSYYQSIL